MRFEAFMTLMFQVELFWVVTPLKHRYLPQH